MQIQLIIDDNMTSIKALIKNDDGTKIIKEVDSFQFISELKSLDFAYSSGLLPFQMNKNNLLGFKKDNICNTYILHYCKQKYNLKYSSTRSSKDYETFSIEYPDIIVVVKISKNRIISLNAFQTYNFNYFKPLESRLYALQRPNIYNSGDLCFGEMDEERNIPPEKIPYLIDLVYRILWNSIGNTDILPAAIYNYEIDTRTKGLDQQKDKEKIDEIKDYISDHKSELMIEYFKQFKKCYDEKYAYINDDDNRKIKILGDLF